MQHNRRCDEIVRLIDDVLSELDVSPEQSAGEREGIEIGVASSTSADSR